MTGEKMVTIYMAHGLWEVRIKLSNLVFIPVLLDTLQLTVLCMAVGTIANGTLANIVSTLAPRSIYLLCTIEAPLSKTSTAG